MEHVTFRQQSASKSPLITMGAMFTGALVATLLFIAIPVILATAKAPQLAKDTPRRISSTEPPPPPIEDEPPPPEPEQEEPPPELETDPPQLSLDQLDLALNPGTGGALAGAGDFALPSLDTSQAALGTDDFLNFKDLDEKPSFVPGGRVAPNYPAAMRNQGIEGAVLVEFFIEKNGSVVNAKVIRSDHPGLEQEALKAAFKWKFKPGTQDGLPVKFKVRIPITFSLNN